MVLASWTASSDLEPLFNTARMEVVITRQARCLCWL